MRKTCLFCILVMASCFEILPALYPTFKMLQVLRQGKSGSVNPKSLSSYSQLNFSIVLMKKVWMWMETDEILLVKSRKLVAEWNTILHSKQTSFWQSCFSLCHNHFCLSAPISSPCFHRTVKEYSKKHYIWFSFDVFKVKKRICIFSSDTLLWLKDLSSGGYSN